MLIPLLMYGFLMHCIWCWRQHKSTQKIANCFCRFRAMPKNIRNLKTALDLSSWQWRRESTHLNMHRLPLIFPWFCLRPRWFYQNCLRRDMHSHWKCLAHVEPNIEPNIVISKQVFTRIHEYFRAIQRVNIVRMVLPTPSESHCCPLHPPSNRWNTYNNLKN